MPDSFDCQPADNARIDIFSIGDEQSPLIRIDNATTNPAALQRYACESPPFEPVSDNLYPGHRAPMPLAFVRQLVLRIDPLIRTVYGLGDVRLASAQCFFSMVTAAAAALKPLQTVPHIDTTHPLHFAMVHYLCAPTYGGTAFFRQDATGFETITPDRDGRWSAARDAMLAGPASPAYPTPQTPGYACIAAIPSAFDRLILYRSNALHAAIIDPALHHPADPRTGRLTATMFIGYHPGRA